MTSSRAFAYIAMEEQLRSRFLGREAVSARRVVHIYARFHIGASLRMPAIRGLYQPIASRNRLGTRPVVWWHSRVAFSAGAANAIPVSRRRHAELKLILAGKAKRPWTCDQPSYGLKVPLSQFLQHAFGVIALQRAYGSYTHAAPAPHGPHDPAIHLQQRLHHLAESPILSRLDRRLFSPRCDARNRAALHDARALEAALLTTAPRAHVKVARVEGRLVPARAHHEDGAPLPPSSLALVSLAFSWLQSVCGEPPVALVSAAGAGVGGRPRV